MNITDTIDSLRSKIPKPIFNKLIDLYCKVNGTKPWGSYYAGDDRHVIPERDLVDHDIDDDCVCVPKQEVIECDDPDSGCVHFLIIHHSLDNRESKRWYRWA